MKSIFFCFSFAFIILSCCFFNTQTLHAIEDECDWCRIEQEHTLLYKSTKDTSNANSVYFELPKTYFAKIIDSADNFFKVDYNSIIGFVLKDNVTLVYSKPITPFPADITLTISDIASATVRETPSVNGNLLGIIPNSETAFYYGKTTGEEAISNLGNSWYFVSYYDKDKEIRGYVYAPLTKNLKQIPENNEEVLLTPASANNQNVLISPDLLDAKNLLLIGILIVVSVCLVFVIFVPLKYLKHKQARKISKIPTINNELDF